MKKSKCGNVFVSVIRDDNTNTCMTMSAASSLVDIHTEAGRGYLVKKDTDHIIRVEMAVKNVSSCSDLDYLHVVMKSQDPCPAVHKCKLLEDKAAAGLCFWKCWCEERLLCEMMLHKGAVQKSWEMCEVWIV